MLRSLLDIGVVDVLDVAFVSALLYAGIVALRNARAGLAVAGMGMLVVTSLVAREIGMQLTAWLLQGFLAIFVVVLVVLFQSELRQIFERIAALGLRRGRSAPAPGDTVSDAIVRACGELVRARHGALLVLEGEDGVDRFVTGGVVLDGVPSDVLLLALFDPASPGHDGAVVIRGDRLIRFATHLPLSDDREQLARRGTRHAAALGLAERTDALCIVISEERGEISVAREGRLRALGGTEELKAVLGAFRHAGTARSPRERIASALRERWAERLAAIALSAVLWLVLVPGAQTVQTTHQIPVAVENVPEGWELEKVEPAQVSATFSGPRRSFVLLDERSLAVRVDAIVAALGRRTFDLADTDVRHPGGVEVVKLDPRRVRITLRRAETPATAAPDHP